MMSRLIFPLRHASSLEAMSSLCQLCRNAFARQDFHTFLHRAFLELNPRSAQETVLSDLDQEVMDSILKRFLKHNRTKISGRGGQQWRP
jgi:hypothetical protein